VIPRGLRIRPVEAVRAWLHAAGITEGLLFRAIWRGGRVKPQGLRGIDVARAVKCYAARAGQGAALLVLHARLRAHHEVRVV